MKPSLCMIALAAVASGCGSGGVAAVPSPCGEAGSCDDSIVVDVVWLQAHVDDTDLQIIDAREGGFETSRIPGALHIPPSALATTIEDVSSQAMPAVEAQPVLRAAGLRNGTTAVVYGAPPEYDPARIVWLLTYYQHGDVRYLDGGLAAWIAAGGETDTDTPSSNATEYTIGDINDDLRVTGSWVLSQLGEEPYDDPAIQLVDARSLAEYDSGHIPSADLVQWTDNLRDGFFRPVDEVEALYPDLDPTALTVTYCLAGWRASVAWLTLTWLGYDDVRVYDGSWIEWGNGEFPVE